MKTKIKTFEDILKDIIPNADQCDWYKPSKAAHDLFFSQFTDKQLQDMAMDKFPVEKVYTKDIFNDPIEYDDNKDNRELCLQSLRDLVKVMGGENV